MRRLPADARARVTLAVLEDAGEAVAVAAARACAGVLAGRPVRLLGHDGTMEPRFVALPVNRLQELVGWPGAVLRIVEQPPDTSAVGHPRRPAAAERLPEHFADRFDAYVTEQFPVHVGEHVTQASDESGFARGVPAGGIRSYVDQLRRVPAPAWHTDRGGGQRIEDAEPVGAAGGVGARGDLPHPPRPVQPAAVSGWASAPGRGGDPPRQRAQRVDQVRPGEVPEWDEVLRRQSRTDLRGPRDLDDVGSGPARPDRYGVTPPESAQLVGTRPAGRHRAEPTGDDGWADDEPEAMRADRDWRRPDTS